MRRVDQRDTAVLPPAYQGYARRFAEVSAQLRRTMEQFGLPLAQDDAHELAAARKRLVQAGAHLRNDGKSIVYGALSPAGERCRSLSRLRARVTAGFASTRISLTIMSIGRTEKIGASKWMPMLKAWANSITLP